MLHSAILPRNGALSTNVPYPYHMGMLRAKPESEKSAKAFLTAKDGRKKEGEAKPKNIGFTRLCHNTAIIFPKELHDILPWKYKGKAPEQKVHIQIEVIGDKVILTSAKPEGK